jgi:hypothetical protein
MPPWAGAQVWPFTKNGILANTPSTSGVYVLGTGWTWVYIGESNDMLRRLLELFSSPTLCIAKYGRLVFGYELVPTEGQRLARLDQLIRELVPACNPPLGSTSSILTPSS